MEMEPGKVLAKTKRITEKNSTEREKDGIKTREFSAYLCELCDYNITKSEICRFTGIKMGTLTGYYESGSYLRPDRLKIEEYVNSRRIYKSYSAMKTNEFAKLFQEIMPNFANEITGDTIARKVGVNPQTISDLRKNAKVSKAVDTKVQYDILYIFYRLCINEFALCRPLLKKVREKLRQALGFSRPWIVYPYFAYCLDDLLADSHCSITEKELADKVKVPVDYISKLRNDIDYPFDFEIKKSILYILKENYHIDNYHNCYKSYFRSGLERDFLFAHTKGGENETNPHILQNLDFFFSDTAMRNPDEEDNSNIEEFEKYIMRKPRELREVIFGNAYAFGCRAVNEDFWNYINRYHYPAVFEEIAEEAEKLLEQYIYPSEFEYIMCVINLFRRLSYNEQCGIINELSDELTAPMPSWYSSEDEEYFASVVESSKLALLTRLMPLSEAFTDSSLKSMTADSSWRYGIFNNGMFGSFDRTDIEEIEKRLTFTSNEWRLNTLLLNAFHSKFKLNDIINRLCEMGHDSK